MENLDSMEISNDEIRHLLTTKYQLDCGPVNDTTRRVMLKMLVRLEEMGKGKATEEDNDNNNSGNSSSSSSDSSTPSKGPDGEEDEFEEIVDADQELVESKFFARFQQVLRVVALLPVAYVCYYTAIHYFEQEE